MGKRSSDNLDAIFNPVAVGIAIGTAAYVSEDASSGFVFHLIAGVLGVIISATMLSSLPLNPNLRTAHNVHRHAAAGLAWISNRTRRQILLVGVTMLAASVMLTDSRWRREAPQLYELIEIVGVVLIAVCVLGQTEWIIRASSRARSRTKTDIGSHNPGLLACMGAAGVGAQSGSLFITFVTLAVAMVIFRAVAAEEPGFSGHGDNLLYLRNAQRNEQIRTLSVEAPPSDRQRIGNACLLFAAVPAADLAEWLQALGYVPVLVLLP